MSFCNGIILENCRLCHINRGESEIASDEHLADEILECVKVQVRDQFTHLLPNVICGDCIKMVKSYYKFQQKVKQIDDHLRGMITLKNEMNEVRHALVCIECPATFHNDEDYKSHIKSHCLSKYHCDDCGKSYRREMNYKSHNCKKDKSSTSTHIRNDVEILENISEFSNNSKDEASLSQSSRFICTRVNCGKICTSATSLKTHELKHDDKRSFLCVTCGKSFLTKNSLTCHEKIHLEVKGYFCEPCNIGFSVRSNLRAHEKKYHEGIRFYCSKCTKAFITKCSLERHELIHTGIKEYRCVTCTAAFYTNKELLKHQRYHQGLRQHKCEECFKTFFERHHLIIHLRSHTGERPYVCKISGCGKSFTESQKLKRHHNAKHPQIT